jgi:hypothetical protein
MASTDSESLFKTFALFGAAGSAQTMPNWALNPTGNYDYCMRLVRPFNL